MAEPVNAGFALERHLSTDDLTASASPTAWGRFFAQPFRELGESGRRFYVAYRT